MSVQLKISEPNHIPHCIVEWKNREKRLESVGRFQKTIHCDCGKDKSRFFSVMSLVVSVFSPSCTVSGLLFFVARFGIVSLLCRPSVRIDQPVGVGTTRDDEIPRSKSLIRKRKTNRNFIGREFRRMNIAHTVTLSFFQQRCRPFQNGRSTADNTSEIKADEVNSSFFFFRKN